jgi:hypothetical protein
MYGVEVSYFIEMPSHLHLLVVAQRPRQMKRFMNFVNSNIAKEAGRLHGWREVLGPQVSTRSHHR